MRRVIPFIVALTGMAAPALADEQQRTIDDVEIVSVSPRPPFGSGIFAVWWSLTGRVDGRSRKFFSIYLGNEVFPVKDDRCAITYHVGAPFGGWGMDESERAEAWMIDKLSCRHADGTPSPVKTNL